MDSVIGFSPESLSLPVRLELTGQWVALEVYTPATLPLRSIEAVGKTPGECLRKLTTRGLDPRKFEIVQMASPYR